MGTALSLTAVALGTVLAFLGVDEAAGFRVEMMGVLLIAGGTLGLIARLLSKACVPTAPRRAVPQRQT